MHSSYLLQQIQSLVLSLLQEPSAECLAVPNPVIHENDKLVVHRGVDERGHYVRVVHLFICLSQFLDGVACVPAFDRGFETYRVVRVY